jgi:ribosomal protein L12E/L44/L45/RPP1/RPP2
VAVSQAEKFLRLRPAWAVEVLSLLTTDKSRVTQERYDDLVKKLGDKFDKICFADSCRNTVEGWVNLWQLLRKAAERVLETACARAAGDDAGEASPEGDEEGDANGDANGDAKDEKPPASDQLEGAKAQLLNCDPKRVTTILPASSLLADKAAIPTERIWPRSFDMFAL